MTFAGIFGIIIGTMMIVQWTLTIIKKGAPEMVTEPIRIGFHIAGEIITAILLLIGGAGLLAGSGWALTLYLLAVGMLLYTVIVSPGYYAQKRVWSMVSMFGAILVLSIVSLILVL